MCQHCQAIGGREYQIDYLRRYLDSLHDRMKETAEKETMVEIERTEHLLTCLETEAGER